MYQKMAVMVTGLLGLNALNPDAYIARENVTRPQGVVSLDEGYLRELSADAAPVVIEYLNSQGRSADVADYVATFRPVTGLADWRYAFHVLPNVSR